MSIFKALDKLTPLQKSVGGDIADIGIAVATKLVQHGTSSAVATAIGMLKAENLQSSASNEFFMSNVPERVTAAKLFSGRLFESGNTYASSVAPEGKMNQQGSTFNSYPPDLGDYFVSFTFYDYQRPTPFDQPKLTAKDSFMLPIPNQLVERHGVRWEEKDTGYLGALADLATYVGNDSNTGTDGATGAAEGAAARAAAAGATRASTYAAERALVAGIGKKIAIAKLLPGDLDKHIGQQTGAIMNPHITQFFTGPEFQSFNFQWRFHPRSPQESDTIRDMCKMFKKNMLPARAVKDVSSFLAYPSMVEVKLHPDTSYFFPFKKCVILSCNIDYAPMGGLLTFEGTKAPRVIEFSLNLKGIEYFLSEDFGGSSKYQSVDQFGQALEDKYNTVKDNATDLAKGVISDVGSFLGL
jgi:hypothetical protein